MTANQYRKQWLKLHRSYEKRAFRIFRKGLRKAARKIPFQTLDEWNYKTAISFNIAESDIFESYYTAYLSIGTLYGNRVVRSIKKDTKSVEIDTFQLAYKQQLQAWLFENAGLKITTVKQSLIDYLLKEISNGLDEGYDIREMSRRIQKLVNSRSFYRWQAMRIARTETTAAANYGASVATEKSIYVLEKIWISSNDARTRQIEKGDKHDHMDMHLVKVEEKGVFNVQGDFLRFPGDPKGQASNVINCRCTVALKAKRDADGRLIRKGDSVSGFNPLGNNVQNPNIFNPARTIKEAEDWALKNGIAKNVSFNNMDIKKINVINKKLKDLKSKYKYNIENITTYSDRTNTPHASWNNKTKTLYVSPDNDYHNNSTWELGKNFKPKNVLHLKGYNRNKVLIEHEFGHSLINSHQNSSEFKEIENIYNSYYKKLKSNARQARKIGVEPNTTSFYKNELYISVQSMRNVDEFIAECFVHTINGGKNKYSLMVKNILDGFAK